MIHSDDTAKDNKNEKFFSFQKLFRWSLKIEENIHECVFDGSLEWVFYSIEIMYASAKQSSQNRGCCKSRFTVVSMQNIIHCYYFLLYYFPYEQL